MTESLSKKQARKLVLLSQRLPPVKQTGKAIDATLTAIEHLGYIQIDTLSVVQRAHHHTLWNRNPRYQTNHLDQLSSDKKVFEYWSHAASYLPMSSYRYSLPRKQAYRNGEQNHWYARNDKLMQAIKQRITTEGPLMAKDFEDKSSQTSKSNVVEWKSKPAKQALDTLFMQGELMVQSRVNFHKVYDISERVVPEGIDTSMPSEDEYYRFLITQYLQSNGLGQASEICYLLKNTKPKVNHYINEMSENNEIKRIKVGSEIYYAPNNALEILSKPLARSRLKILSPFDNLLIQRKRMKALFDFDYLIECYVPKEKRKYGYFSLPILWDGKLFARMDCKVDKASYTLNIKHLAFEDLSFNIELFSIAFHKELISFMKFNNCDSYQLYSTTPNAYLNKINEYFVC